VQRHDHSEESQPLRRQGERRKDAAPVTVDQRSGDRRKNKPGLTGLLRTLLRR
jgi:hypothetical protein